MVHYHNKTEYDGKEMIETFDYQNIENNPETIMRKDLLIERYQKILKNNPNFLEVGLGAGEMSIMVPEKYGSLTAIDNEIKNCNYLKKNIEKYNLPNANIICRNIEDVELPYSQYDNILLMNTLEHLKDPIRVLEKLALSLKDDGYMHISVNLAHSIHRLLGVKLGIISNIEELSESDIRYGHYRIYTPDLLRKHVSDAGLKVVYEQFMYLKPFPTSMLGSLSSDQHKALGFLGSDFPEFASYIYMEIAKINKS
jgi:SAM-dependent methyltransferase